jgi:hypothetical protein
VVVLIWVYVIACSAFKNAQTEDLFRRYKQGWVWSWSHTHPTFQMLVLDPLFKFFFFSTSFLSIQWWKCIVVYSVYIPLCFTHLQGRCGGMDQRHVYLYIILPVIAGSISIIQLSWESDSSSIFTECFGTLWIE